MSKPMTKIEALKSAQDSQISAAKHGEHYDLFHEPLTLCWTLRRLDNSIVEKFPYEEPKPLARDTLVKEGNVFRWAFGELDDNGVNLFYPKGWNSKSNIELGIESLMPVSDFEIIETPTDFETMQTPDGVCMHYSCKEYRYKYEDYKLTEHCQRCRTSVSEPSGLKGE